MGFPRRIAGGTMRILAGLILGTFVLMWAGGMPAHAAREPLQAAEHCAAFRAKGLDQFANCWNEQMASTRQKQVIKCWNENPHAIGQFALCSSNIRLTATDKRLVGCIGSGRGDLMVVANCAAGNALTPGQRHAAECIAKNRQNPNPSAVAMCIGTSHLSPEQQRLANCAINHQSDAFAATLCVAGGRVNPEQRRLAECVAKNWGDLTGAAVCAGGSRLTSEQAIIAQCAVATGFVPVAAAGCIGTQLAVAELQKCMTGQIGGNGCFGKNNEAVKLVRVAWKGISGGKNSALNNPDQIWGGRNSVVHNPAQIWGGPNSVFNNPSTIFGGSHSAVNEFVKKPLGGPHSAVNEFAKKPLGGRNSVFHKNLGL
jgi:hypothetical protein